MSNAGNATPPTALGRSPFGHAAPSILVALGYAVALTGWLLAGDRLPGGRWFAVHLFTLGVLTNLVLTFTEHFARTLTRAPGERAGWWPLVTNLGVALTLVGLPSGSLALLVPGATIVTTSVLTALLRLRAARLAALGARFVWIVRRYEAAHGFFIVGAVLGGLLGAGVVAGDWYLGARLAHLHANLLGWGGLTLLATLVFFGPTMATCRIEPGADAHAARALRAGVAGLAAAVLLLLLIGVDGVWGTGARLGAAGGLAVLAAGGSRVCLAVTRAVAGAKPGSPRPLLLALGGWLPLVLWADVLVVATGSWRWLDAIGAAALAGVLAQAVLATLLYLAPMLRGRSTLARDLIRGRLEVGARSRAAGWNLGVVLVTAGATRLVEAPLVGIGLGLLLLVLTTSLAAGLWPVQADAPADRSAVSRRIRSNARA